MQAHGQMHMIGYTTDSKALTSLIPNDGCQVGVQRLTHGFVQQRTTVFCAEHDVNQNRTQRLGHRPNYKSGFQPLVNLAAKPLGLRPRLVWNAPSALLNCALLLGAISLVVGCTTPKPTTQSPTLSTTHYTSRPTTPPPPFKLFHQSPDTLTLTTTESASNTQIAALIYQLRDAANTHTFGSIHLPQAVIDARSPIIWFHIYRGPKCASEKYAAKLPCGPSYHAAGEFTLGSFHDPNRTDGELNLDENHTTALWNPDSK